MSLGHERLAMSGERVLERCESCGELYEPHLGRDGACFTCATHLGCACADDAEADTGDLHQHIAAIVALKKPGLGDIERALGVRLHGTGHNTYGEQFAGGPSGVFKKVVFKTARERPSWLVGWEYDSSQMPCEDEIDLSRYGKRTGLRVNPPEMNSHTFTFEHRGFLLFVSFDNTTRRLRSAALHHP